MSEVARRRAWKKALKALAGFQPVTHAVRVYKWVPTNHRPSMDQAEVLAVVEALESEGIRFWLAGGWGIDALWGRQSRPHEDLDILLEHFDESAPRVIAALGRRSYEHTAVDDPPLWLQRRGELRDGGGHCIELVSLAPDLLDRLGEVDGGQWLFGVGSLGDRTVPCLSVEAQRMFHTGFKRRPRDFHNQYILRNRL